MATIIPVVLKKNKREDDTWNVVYRLTHKRTSRYIKTTHYVDRSQLDKEFNISMNFVIYYLSSDLKAYRKKIDGMGTIVDQMTVDDLKDSLLIDAAQIDFLEFTVRYIEEIKVDTDKEENTINGYESLLANLKRYSKGSLYVHQINSKFIRGFMTYLRNTGLSDSTIRIYIFRFGRVFKEIKLVYNNEDTGIIRIPQNPFSVIELPKKKTPPRRILTIDQIRTIRDYNVRPMYFIGRDVFMLTFYLCGINFMDLYHNAERFLANGERVDYERSKTRKKREDYAYISVKIPDEAIPLLNHLVEYKAKYKHKTKLFLHARVNRYLQRIALKSGIDKKVTTYYARHSFATIARNDCDCRKEDVSIALNHVDQASRVTDIYLEPDWSKIDRVQEAVIKKINEDL